MSALSACDVRQDRRGNTHADRNTGRDTATETRAAQGSVTQPGRPAFDFYLLSMSLHATFCADHRDYAECQVASRPLVIHGLWPENVAPRTYPHDCPAPALELDPALRRELSDFMPGTQAGLEQHEWREHGACTGLDGNDYFRGALALARTLDAALSPTLTTLAGGEASALRLRAAADAYNPGLAATLTFHCRMPHGAGSHGRPMLFEIRQCVAADGAGGAPGTLLDCAKVNRHDQGCGATFRIARP